MEMPAGEVSASEQGAATGDVPRTGASTGVDRAAALTAALAELERHVGEAGWEQPARLFALVLTDDFVLAEPALATDLGLRSSDAGGMPGALTAVEQEHFHSAGELLADLAGVSWPDSVFGCAVSVVRTFLPPAAEAELPDSDSAAAAFVASHPQRQDIRVVVGADRSGNRYGVARLVSQPDELLGAADLVPGLADVLAHTLA